jgi:sugar/nucleoside kinase (ribokinase family)
LAEYGGFVVVTDGAGASFVLQDNEVVAKATPRPCGTFVDPTGAGDAFAGAFLALCSFESDLNRVLSVANGTAGKVLRGLGIADLLAELELGDHHEI